LFVYTGLSLPLLDFQHVGILKLEGADPWKYTSFPCAFPLQGCIPWDSSKQIPEEANIFSPEVLGCDTACTASSGCWSMLGSGAGCCWALHIPFTVWPNVNQKLQPWGTKKGGSRGDSHTGGSYFPKEPIMTTILMFAGARLWRKQCKNSRMRTARDKYSLENVARAAWVKACRAAVKGKIRSCNERPWAMLKTKTPRHCATASPSPNCHKMLLPSAQWLHSSVRNLPYSVFSGLEHKWVGEELLDR